MGATKKTYWFTTEPLEENEFFEFKSKQTKIKDWGVRIDTDELYKNDPIFKKLVHNVKISTKLRDEYINKMNV
jgi:hypothetical protein